jgi:hypothetical protein
VTRRATLVIVALAVSGFAGPAVGQQAAGYVPKKTAWGDPDFRGTWPVEQINPAGIPLERPTAFGDRLLMTDEEFAERLEAAKRSDEGYRNEVGADGTVGLADWLLASPFGRRTSQIVDPADGRLPPLTSEGEALFRAGRNSWIDGQAIDWVTDLDAYDRCLPRGFPASMLPWPGGNGIRIFQSPGFVVLQLEILGTRIVPLGSGEPWPAAVRGWFGQSRGHWQGDTLVIETANIVAGDSATDDVWQRASSPLPGRGKGTVPMSTQARTVERLTMTGPDTIAYAVTYTDPQVFTAPWTVELEWTRDSAYRLHEYACHEGNVAIRDMIKASRAQRRLDAAAAQ